MDTTEEEPHRRTFTERAVNGAWDDVSGIRPKLIALRAALALLPDYAMCRVRTQLLRTAGFQIDWGTTFFGAPRLAGDAKLFSRLRVGSDTAINVGLTLDMGADVTIGSGVSIGHDVMILTVNHKLGSESRRAGPAHCLPVTIEDGAWVCSRATLLPGVTVGRGAVVSAGSVVNKNVPPNSIVAGVPARVVAAKIPGRR